VHAQFALIDETLFRFMHKFHRVFNGENVAFEGIVQIVDHAGEGSGFTGAGWAGD
jgi:hypothetical protein